MIHGEPVTQIINIFDIKVPHVSKVNEYHFLFADSFNGEQKHVSSYRCKHSNNILLPTSTVVSITGNLILDIYEVSIMLTIKTRINDIIWDR